MIKKLPLYIIIPASAAVLYAVTSGYTVDKGFKYRVLDFISEHSLTDKTVILAPSSSSILNRYYTQPDLSHAEAPGFQYDTGDWHDHVLWPDYRYLEKEQKGVYLYGSRGEEVNIVSYGSMKVNLSYGDSLFTDKKYKQYDEDTPASSLVNSGFVPDQEMQIHLEGTIGKRLTVYIDHDSRKEDNIYIMQYRALREDEVVREINAGMIDINFNHSKYAIYDNAESKGMGVDMTLKKKDFQIRAFASIMRGEAEVEYFKGTSSPGSIKLLEYQYMKEYYYQLEPFKRYDGIQNRTSLPVNAADFYDLTTFTSSPASPETYEPEAVNINTSGFELYMDDQDPYNNFNAIQLSLDNGYYTKLQSGNDYSINYTTGLITFTRDIPDKARVFAVYTLEGGSTATSDPSARTYVAEFPGKLFVFLKYGRAMKEDIGAFGVYPLTPATDYNGDGVCNLDIYEVRSYYYIGDSNLLADNLRIIFYNENDIMSKKDVGGQSEIASIGKYKVDYTKGILYFNLREPFKYLLAQIDRDSIIYTENQQDTVYEYSRYRIGIDYYRDSRSFQLNHFNIIPDTVRVKINGSEISRTLYTVDYTSGYLVFNNPYNPLIDSETEIEIRYEYLPLGGQSQNFVGGLRADYSITRNLNLGGSVLYTKSSESGTIPDIDSTPSQTTLLEADALLDMDEKAFKKVAKFLTKKEPRRFPVEFKAYGEYARSFHDPNIFGKAMIDNMESSEELLDLSMSEKDWIPASMPSGTTQLDRARLNYYYYRDPSDPSSLEGLSFLPIAVDYSVKPGPYNVATGHISPAILSDTSQLSMVMDFDFSSGDYASVATRKLSGSAVDLSGVQYVEIWYKYEGEATTDSLNLYLDIGKINEDSDGDGVLDTEDANRNGEIDSNPGTGYSEDRGYEFNGNNSTVVGSGPGLSSYTKGDGILNSEDINGNGVLDTSENIYTPAPAGITIDASDSSWQKQRVYIDPTAFTASTTELLKQVEAVRLYVEKGAGNIGNGGRLYIDTIKFVSSRWRNFLVGTSASDPLQGNAAGPSNMAVTLVDSINDSDYRSGSFVFWNKDIYTTFYGEMDSEELAKEQESALKIDYTVPAGMANVSATRRFSKPFDLRHYKTLNVWLNYRTPPGGEIGVIIGSSDTDYYEYRFQVSQQLIWQEIRLRLRGDSSSLIVPHAVHGDPDIKRINFITFLIYPPDASGCTGTLWLNEVYASDAVELEDDAYWVESELKITEPFFKTKKGTPVFSDFNVRYTRKSHGTDFNTVSKTVSDISETYDEFHTAMEIVPNLTTSISYIKEESETDSLNDEVDETKRGETLKNSVYWLTDYSSTKNAVPTVHLSYKYDAYENEIRNKITDYWVDRDSYKYSHASSINMTERIENFLWGKLNTAFSLHMLFKEEEIDRSSNDLDAASLGELVSLEENEKRQKTLTSIDLNYECKAFYLQPLIIFGSEEIVNVSGRDVINDTEIVDDLWGDFHFPYDYTGNLKFVERSKKGSLILGTRYWKYLTPSYIFNVQYQENKFSDYSDTEDMGRFNRSRDAQSFISTRIVIPINLFEVDTLKCVKNINLTYGRSLYMLENGVPYEGEQVDFYEEKYGAPRSVNKLLDAGMNIFRYYPFYFFIGRDNFANGRDYVHRTLNSSIRLSDGTAVADYNNQLRAIENFALNWSVDLDKVVINSGGGLDQIVQRLNIYGVPQQTVSWHCNIDFNFDLMKLFNFWFFRANREGLPYHASTIDLGYSYKNNMFITSNIEEHVHSPAFGITFKWDRASVGVNFSVDFRIKNNKEYIPVNELSRSGRDDIYYENMPEYVSFHERDEGYNLSVVYETDVKWIYNIFVGFYRLTAFPIYRLEYTMNIKRYDYNKTVSPEPYDLHYIESRLTLDLNKYIQGGFYSKFVLEQYRNRTSESVSREIFSYELGLDFSLIF